jgi:hypothetical protein
MKHLLNIALLFWIAISSAQTKLELTPDGFQPLEMKTPNLPIDQLLQASKSWAPYYNKKGYDVSDVTANSLKIEARAENAFYSYNVGVKYDYDIVYTLKIVFEEDKQYKLSISVKEIYADKVLLKTTTTDFFNAEGKLKDDYRDAKPSLENTINRIVKSYANYIDQ